MVVLGPSLILERKLQESDSKLSVPKLKAREKQK